MLNINGEQILVIDSQIHVWKNESANAPWPETRKSYAQLDGESPSISELLSKMERAGVDRAILVPPSFAGDDNEVALEASKTHPDKFAVMGRVRLECGPSDTDLSRWRDAPGMLGVRLTFARGAALKWLTDGTADWFWPEAEALDLPVMVFAPNQAELLLPILERYPDLRLIIDHAGIPTSSPPLPVLEIVERILPLSHFNNVAVKASALPCTVTEDFPFPTAQRCVHRLIDSFGAERVFWGTDLTRLPCSYEEAVRFLAEPGGLSVKELNSVMGSGLANWLGWKVDK